MEKLAIYFSPRKGVKNIAVKPRGEVLQNEKKGGYIKMKKLITMAVISMLFAFSVNGYAQDWLNGNIRYEGTFHQSSFGDTRVTPENRSFQSFQEGEQYANMQFGSDLGLFPDGEAGFQGSIFQSQGVRRDFDIPVDVLPNGVISITGYDFFESTSNLWVNTGGIPPTFTTPPDTGGTAITP